MAFCVSDSTAQTTSAWCPDFNLPLARQYHICEHCDGNNLVAEGELLQTVFTGGGQPGLYKATVQTMRCQNTDCGKLSMPQARHYALWPSPSVWFDPSVLVHGYLRKEQGGLSSTSEVQSMLRSQRARFPEYCKQFPELRESDYTAAELAVECVLRLIRNIKPQGDGAEFRLDQQPVLSAVRCWACFPNRYFRIYADASYAAPRNAQAGAFGDLYHVLAYMLPQNVVAREQRRHAAMMKKPTVGKDPKSSNPPPSTSAIIPPPRRRVTNNAPRTPTLRGGGGAA